MEDERQEMGVEDMTEDEENAVNCLEEDIVATLDEIKQAVGEDAILRQVIEDSKRGYMSGGTGQSEYAGVFQELSHLDGLLWKGRQLVIPPKLQVRVLEAAYEGHWLRQTVRECVTSDLGCAAGDTRNSLAPR